MYLKIKNIKTKNSFLYNVKNLLKSVYFSVVKLLLTRDLLTSAFLLVVILTFSTLIPTAFPQNFSHSDYNNDIEKLKYYTITENKDSFYITLKNILREGKYSLNAIMGIPELISWSKEEFFWELLYEQWYSPYLLINYECLPEVFTETYVKNINKLKLSVSKKILAKIFVYYLSCKYDSLENLADYYINNFNKRDLRVYHLLTLSYIKQGKYEPAKLLLETLVKKDPKYYFTYAFYYNEIGVYPKGLEMIDKYYENYPEDVFLYYYKAMLLSKSKLYNEALKWIEKTLDKNPDNPLFLLKKIEIEYLNKNYKSVIQLSDNLIKQGLYREQLYFYQGNSYASMNDLKNACDCWKKSATLGNDFSQTYYNYFCKNK